MDIIIIIILTAAAGSLEVIEVVFARGSLPSEPRLLERPAKESSDPKLVDWVGDTAPGLDFRDRDMMW